MPVPFLFLFTFNNALLNIMFNSVYPSLSMKSVSGVLFSLISNASFSMAPNIQPCYTFWDLISSKVHSIPDVLQMTTYKYRQEALLLGDYMSSLNQESENDKQSFKP